MERVNISKAIKNDATILSFIISAAIFLVMGIVMYFLAESVGEYVPFIFFGLGSLSAIIVLLRILMLNSFVAENKVYKAKITKRITYRSTRYIRFEYIVDGVTYKKTNGLFANKNSRDYVEGIEVDILISANNPKKALIRDIYFD